MGIRKFILESWSAFDTTSEKDPYCFASFMIEIKLSLGYPFQLSKARIIDRIYTILI